MAPRSTVRSAHPMAAPVSKRLPWWAVVLPALAFAALLAVATGSAHADAGAAGVPVAQLLHRLGEAVLRLFARFA